MTICSHGSMSDRVETVVSAPSKTLNDVQIAKLSHRFELLDVDHSGFLEIDDYQEIARRMQRLMGIAPESSQGKRLFAVYSALYLAMHHTADTDGDRRISLEEFI